MPEDAPRDDADAASSRRPTHQGGGSPEQPGHAIIMPAVIDTAAVPVRVERWSATAGRLYRIVGHYLGGIEADQCAADPIQVAGPWTPVEHCPLPASTLTWSLWTHTGADAPGRYEIVLKVDDRAIRTRRLDLFLLRAEITIDEYDPEVNARLSVSETAHPEALTVSSLRDSREVESLRGPERSERAASASRAIRSAWRHAARNSRAVFDGAPAASPPPPPAPGR